MTSQTRLAESAGPGRRAFLRISLGVGLGLGGVGLAGCSADNPLNNPLSDEQTPAEKAVRDLEPDVAVAVEAVTLISAARAAVTSTGERHVALAAKLSGLLEAHAAHLDALVDAVPDGVDTSPATAAPYVVPKGPARALDQLSATEQKVHDDLVGLALRAQSGAFARLLGAMAASLSQQLVGLAA
jgi:hypothetical protein